MDYKLRCTTKSTRHFSQPKIESLQTVVQTDKQQMIIRIDVAQYEPSVIRLIVEDADQANTILTDRILDEGQTFFLVRLPLVGVNTKITVYNENYGLIDNDTSFKVTGISKQHLIKRLDLIDLRNPSLKNFIVFAQQFAYNAGNLPTNDPNNDNDLYLSNCKKFGIKYLDVIVDEHGTPIPTPASIQENGLIDCCSQQFREYTVPMRMAILFHEYSHIFLNNNPSNEVEADLNGLMIFLALGYPRVEAYQAWIDTFREYDTDENWERYQIMEQFIADFENNKILFNHRF